MVHVLVEKGVELRASVESLATTIGESLLPDELLLALSRHSLVLWGVEVLGLLGELAVAIVVIRVQSGVMIAPVSEFTLVGINFSLEDRVVDLHGIFSAAGLADRTSALTSVAAARSMTVGGETMIARRVVTDEVESGRDFVL